MPVPHLRSRVHAPAAWASAVGLAAFDSLYLDFGVEGSMWFDEDDLLFGRYPAPTNTVEKYCGKFIRRLFNVLCNCTSLLFSIINWVGWTQASYIIPALVCPDLELTNGGSGKGRLWNVFLVVLSPILMWASDTLFIDSGMDVVAEVDPDRVPYWGHGHWVQLRAFGRSLVAFVGQFTVWTGGYNLLSGVRGQPLSLARWHAQLCQGYVSNRRHVLACTELPWSHMRSQPNYADNDDLREPEQQRGCCDT